MLRRTSTLPLAVAVLLLLLLHAAAGAAPARCRPSEPCWPTAEDVKALSAALDDGAPRSLHWQGPGTPRTCAVPVNSPGSQPLYGDNTAMHAVYTRDMATSNGTCFVAGDVTPFCLQSVRNAPYNGWQPAFVVWPLSTAHVAAAVAFATKHNLCIAVAGPGHDFLNRHSCPDGVMIRTSLLKHVRWAPDNSTVTFGAGVVFSEAQEITASRGRFIASGWGITVGIVGWTLGGGHGPFGNLVGLGVDNLVAATVVLADGTVANVSESSNPDLFWAMRGGGGSVWGVVTSLTLATHANPVGGFTKVMATTGGYYCGSGVDDLNALSDGYFKWAQQLPPSWSGLAYFIPAASPNTTECPLLWEFFSMYVFAGPASSPDFQRYYSQINLPGQAQHNATAYATWWDCVKDYVLEKITPVSFLAPVPAPSPAPTPSLSLSPSPSTSTSMSTSTSTSTSTSQAAPAPSPPEWAVVGGVPSVLVSRDRVAAGALSEFVKTQFQRCIKFDDCVVLQLFHDVAFTARPAGAAARLSVSQGFLDAMYHAILAGPRSQASMHATYALLGNNSYMNEAAYEMGATDTAWRQRQWGDNYAQLAAIKQQYDPHGAFWCHHCVGDGD